MSKPRSVAFYLLVWTLVAAFGVACVFLGRWQWHRHETRSAANRVTVANYDAAPVPLDSVVPVPDAASSPALSWKVVSAQGRYGPDTVLIRGRVQDGAGAYLVLSPFVENSGTVVWINRGWITMPDDAGAPSELPSPPAGPVTVTGHLRPAERAGTRTAPAGQSFTITPQVLAEVGELPAAEISTMVSSYYVEAIAEVPPATQALGGYARPDIDDGPHLSYALQWWLFALAAPVVVAVVLRRTQTGRSSATPATASGTTAAQPQNPSTQASAPATPVAPPTSAAARLAARLRAGERRDAADEDAEDARAQASSTSSR